MSAIFFLAFVSAIIISVSAMAVSRTKVIVSGAAGRTGSLVFKKLLESDDFSPVGIIRRLKSGKKLTKQLSLKPEQLVQADVTDTTSLAKAIIDTGAQNYVLCTSAVPKIKIWSLVKVILGKIIGKQFRPEFYFEKNLTP